MNSIVKNKWPLSLSLLLTLLALLLLLLLLAACGPSAGPQELTLTAKFEAGKLTPETLQAKQGDMVTLQIETDRPGSFHLHGYDLEEAGGVGTVTDFQFVADATGRYRIAFHGGVGPDDSGDTESMETGEAGKTGEAGETGETGEAGEAGEAMETMDTSAEHEAATNTGHDHDEPSSNDENDTGKESAVGEPVELEIGFLEVLPR